MPSTRRSIDSSESVDSIISAPPQAAAPATTGHGMHGGRNTEVRRHSLTSFSGPRAPPIVASASFDNNPDSSSSSNAKSQHVSGSAPFEIRDFSTGRQSSHLVELFSSNASSSSDTPLGLNARPPFVTTFTQQQRPTPTTGAYRSNANLRTKRFEDSLSASRSQSTTLHAPSWNTSVLNVATTSASMGGIPTGGMRGNPGHHRVRSNGSNSGFDRSAAAAPGVVVMGGTSTGGSVSSPTGGLPTSTANPDRGTLRQQHRRYNVGDKVLVCNHQSRWANLVNRHGFPDEGGVTPEEQRGPYVYVLATVKKVHFEEDAQYYTILRADTETEQRADAAWMEPIKSKRGEEAALAAATNRRFITSNNNSEANNTMEKSSKRRKTLGLAGAANFPGCAANIVLTPFRLLFHCVDRAIGRSVRAASHLVYHATKRQATVILNGSKPYSYSCKITGVNMLVVCSTWFVFIDQIRLAFFPPSADYTMAIISACTWCVLMLELMLEVFIRPQNYHELLKSDKAFAPTTVRIVNRFHVVVEGVSLLLFVPEFYCLFTSEKTCSDRISFSLLSSSINAIIGADRRAAFFGRLHFALIRLRIFGLVRHWKQMWIIYSIKYPKSKSSTKNGIISGVFIPQSGDAIVSDCPMPERRDMKNKKSDTEMQTAKSGEKPADTSKSQDDQHEAHLTNATNIGTALIVINSHRVLIIIGAIAGLLPIAFTISANGRANAVSRNMVNQLQGTNLLVLDAANKSCQFLDNATASWMIGVTGSLQVVDQARLLWLQVLPARCNLLSSNGVATAYYCEGLTSAEGNNEEISEVCSVWSSGFSNVTIDGLANKTGARTGALSVYTQVASSLYTDASGVTAETTFNVTAVFNEQHTVKSANFTSFLLQASLLVFVLLGLSVLRVDASRLVLSPLRRMLKIVALYAKNPLAKPPRRSRKGQGESDDNSDESDYSDFDSDDELTKKDELGNFETEQLITAVAKITDLLRKCWGVAGAGIISSNLSRQDDGSTAVFNPCVPGKCVYALFAFAAIKGFDHQLRALGGEIMILINNVAAVLHKEVYRWGFGDSGQCNKNLGSAFLMVYRIGDVREVREKRDRATDVIFKSSAVEKSRVQSKVRRRGRSASANTGDSSSSTSKFRKGPRLIMTTTRTSSNRVIHDDTLSLASLPGISAFTDRALLGMLKTYAGIYRDQKLLSWKNDFRLGAGVGAFSVDMIFGMDAGWAVEGAVGSEYKIDATYLSPHVNMASRMMSACKQYGVNILLSQAVEELLSDAARSKLRHLDTVIVKGSSLKQRIFTYDARHKGVDFFLIARSEEQADRDSESYSPKIWETDADLKAMRQHIGHDFLQLFKMGRKEYLEGNWNDAIKHLKEADALMFDMVVEEGYIEDELHEIQNRIMDGEDAKYEEDMVREEMGDGPSQALVAFMEREGGKSPANWKGYRPLTIK